MNDLHKLVGKTIKVGGDRLIKIESVFSGKLETFFLVRWKDTNEVFCEYTEKIFELMRE